ncbi:MAG: hypothetical protein VYB40_00440 [Candidatus Thermoplasmatota archaeon]|nr:hypothetical protein [Candidatus Thermoplasmatota archaeon]
MQAPTGPTGPPVSGPSGPPSIAGPSGPPSDVNPAQFDPLAEIEDARSRRQERENRLESLEKKRNRARVNVYLFLAITVIMGIFAFFPQTIGDNTENPQQFMSKNQAEQWFADGGNEPNKIWDGETESSSSPYKNIYIPGLDIGSISEVRVDVSVVVWRASGNTNFTAALYDGECGTNSNSDVTKLPEGAWEHSGKDASPGESVELTLHTAPGQKCFIVFWEETVDNLDIRATMDVEVEVYWPRMFTIPAGIICFLLSGFAFIGAQKTGAAYKSLKYPEGQPKKNIEQEVLEAAEEEHRGEQLVMQEESDSDISNSQTDSSEQVAEETVVQEADSAAAWSDEQLLSAGWSQEQIDAMRNG